MKIRLILFLNVFFLLLLEAACQYPAKNKTLTATDRQICDSLKLDTTIVLQLRTVTDSLIRPFPLNLSDELDMDFDTGIVYNPGFLLNTPASLTDSIVQLLYDGFKQKGYTIFVLDRSYGSRNKPDIVGVVKTVDKYAIIQQVQTNGVNWDIGNDSLLSIIRRFDKKYSLDLIGASGDWLEFTIKNTPQSWTTLAKEIYKICPDVVDQGAGTIAELAKELRTTRRLYLWWD